LTSKRIGGAQANLGSTSLQISHSSDTREQSHYTTDGDEVCGKTLAQRDGVEDGDVVKGTGAATTVTALATAKVTTLQPVNAPPCATAVKSIAVSPKQHDTAWKEGPHPGPDEEAVATPSTAVSAREAPREQSSIRARLAGAGDGGVAAIKPLPLHSQATEAEPSKLPSTAFIEALGTDGTTTLFPPLEIRAGAVLTVTRPESSPSAFEVEHLPNFAIVKRVHDDAEVEVELLLGKMVLEKDDSKRLYRAKKSALRSAGEMKYWAQRRCRGAIYTCAYDQGSMHESLKCGMAFDIFPAREQGIDYSVTGPLFKDHVGGDWAVKQGMIIEERRKRINDAINMWDEFNSIALCSNMLVEDCEGSIYVVLFIVKNGRTMMHFVLCAFIGEKQESRTQVNEGRSDANKREGDIKLFQWTVVKPVTAPRASAKTAEGGNNSPSKAQSHDIQYFSSTRSPEQVERVMKEATSQMRDAHIFGLFPRTYATTKVKRYGIPPFTVTDRGAIRPRRSKSMISHVDSPKATRAGIPTSADGKNRGPGQQHDVGQIASGKPPFVLAGSNGVTPKMNLSELAQRALPTAPSQLQAKLERQGEARRNRREKKRKAAALGQAAQTQQAQRRPTHNGVETNNNATAPTKVIPTASTPQQSIAPALQNLMMNPLGMPPLPALARPEMQAVDPSLLRSLYAQSLAPQLNNNLFGAAQVCIHC